MKKPKFCPMLFSTLMVQALLNGTKTQTRRIIKQKIFFKGDKDDPSERSEPRYYSVDGYELEESVPLSLSDIQVNIGNVIWVRETFRQYFRTDDNGYTDFDKQIIEYKADNDFPILLVDGNGFAELNKNGEEKYVSWKPSMFMPKDACRIWLKVTNVRVERLNDISESDAKAEGIKTKPYGSHPFFCTIDYEGAKRHKASKNNSVEYRNFEPGYCADTGFQFRNSYESLWNSINGKESWQENPFVWVYEFEVLTEQPEGFIENK